MWERLFSLSENKTGIRTEIFAGLTTFLTMAYIIFVQPTILTTDFAGRPTGIDFGAVLLATCLGSAFASIFMGLWSNYPIALAPGMGENFFFVSVVMSLSSLGMGQEWQVALGIVFVSGIIFLILSILRVRQMIIDAISPSMRVGIAVGIGLFIAFIGLRNGGIIIEKSGTLVGLNPHFMTGDSFIFFFGLLTTAALHSRRIQGSILLGIVVCAFLAWILKKVSLPPVPFGLPDIQHSAIFKMDIRQTLTLACLPFIFVFTFMVMLDTVGTLIGVAEQAGFIKDNKLPRADKVLIVDAVATIAGSCLGTSTITSYIESAAGVQYGGRTGLTSVTTGILFLLALFFSPIIGMVGQYAPVTAPALVIVGAMMIQNVSKIDWSRYDECIPAFITMLGIPLSYSIADGLALGFMSYPAIKLLSGKAKEVKWLMYLLALILLAYFLFVRQRMW
jgi:AGZA family xanthine/uracil permease-like MFS transporter